MDKTMLKARVKELAAEGRRLHRELLSLKGPERHEGWLRKRQVGQEARAALLAYAFRRGVPYAVLEPGGKAGSNLPYVVSQLLICEVKVVLEWMVAEDASGRVRAHLEARAVARKAWLERRVRQHGADRERWAGLRKGAA